MEPIFRTKSSSPGISTFSFAIGDFMAEERKLNFSGDYEKIPERMRSAIARYLFDGTKPGDFLSAVISNNLTKAVFSADDENLPLLRLYVQWFYWEAPGNSWGSADAMREWMRSRPLLTAATLEQRGANFSGF
jgi:hypothetical protein